MADQDLNTPRPFLAGTKIRNLLGQHFGRLLVIQYAGKSKHNATLWLCACSCGEPTTTTSSALNAGSCNSCGCLNLEKFKERITKHGETSRTGGKSPEYSAYQDAKQRCTISDHKWYSSYGQRGIEFRFTSFEQFLSEIGRRPTSQHSLDRINNNGHYEPGNVRWATKQEQALNTRRSVLLTVGEITQNIDDWSKVSSTAAEVIYTRKQKYHWCDSCAIYNGHRQRCSHIGRTKRGLWRLGVKKTPQD